MTRKLQETDNISFFMPAYNCADTVVESVESIIHGNWTEGDELIIVDDGSNDGKTPSALAKLKEQYPFINIITSKVNRGCPAARNLGYRHAKHPIIFNLYADDVLVPGSVPRLKKHMVAQGADMAGFAQDRFFQKSRLGKKIVSITWISPPGQLTFADIVAGDINPGPGGNYMFTKEIWERVGGVWEYGKGLIEAWGFTLKCLAHGAKFAVLPDSFYYHRYGHDSLTLREARKTNMSLMATKMITPYLDLIHEGDAAYVRSEMGSKEWYTNEKKRVLRLKNGEVGRIGIVVISLEERIKRGLLRFARKIKGMHSC